MTEQDKSLDKALAELEKDGIKVTRLGSNVVDPIAVVSTGSITLDIATGVGGFPRGRIVEVFGPEMSGKTTIALVAMGQAQKAGGRVAFIDAEQSLSFEWAKKLGVNVGELYFNQPDYGEQGLDTAMKLLKTKAFDMIVIDSVSALTPKAQIEGKVEDQFMGLQARMMSKALGNMATVANKTKTTVIFINQLREKIGVMYGNPEVTSGGKALKFYASMRIRVNTVSKSAVENEAGEKIAHRVAAKVVKNKCAAPFREAEFLLNFETGIDNDSELFDAAMVKGIIALDGRTYKYDKWEVVGRDKCKELIQNTPEMKAKLIEDVKVKGSVGSIEIENDSDVDIEDELTLDLSSSKKSKKKKDLEEEE